MNPIDTMNGIKPATRVEGDRPGGGVRGNANSTQGALGRSENKLADDTVELTDTASRLSQLTQDVSKVDGVDVARVEAIRQQIAEGSYQLDAGRIAEALVQLEKDLL